MVAVTVGYDINERIAAELITGGTMVSGGRGNWVRDTAYLMMGGGVRLSIPMSDRLNLTAAPAVSYFRLTNQVEPTDSACGAILRGGFEYYAHIRHFSVGAELVLMMPVAPIRLFVAITPTIKYTF